MRSVAQSRSAGVILICLDLVSLAALTRLEILVVPVFQNIVARRRPLHRLLWERLDLIKLLRRSAILNRMLYIRVVDILVAAQGSWHRTLTRLLIIGWGVQRRRSRIGNVAVPELLGQESRNKTGALAHGRVDGRTLSRRT